MLLFIRRQMESINFLIWCFNTSHVTLYPYIVSRKIEGLRFQYISCYSLSFSDSYQDTGYCVSIHLMLLFIWAFCPETSACRVSIHLMLLFIGGWRMLKEKLVMFQYISCYSLSFNCDVSVVIRWMFQYISCYSLSIIQRWNPAFKWGFQYISCYSLSKYGF